MFLDDATQESARRIEQETLRMEELLVQQSTMTELGTLTMQACSDRRATVHTSTTPGLSTILRLDVHGTITGCSNALYGDFFGTNIGEISVIKNALDGNPHSYGVMRQGSTKTLMIAVPLFQTTTTTPYPRFDAPVKGALALFMDLHALGDWSIGTTQLSTYRILDETGVILVGDTETAFETPRFWIQRAQSDLIVGDKRWSLETMQHVPWINKVGFWIGLGLLFLGGLLFSMKTQPPCSCSTVHSRRVLAIDLADILEHIVGAHNHGTVLRFTDIGQQCNLTKPTVRSKLQELEKQGLIATRIDGREKFIYPTAEGIACVSKKKELSPQAF